jgi:hypothetical protein
MDSEILITEFDIDGNDVKKTSKIPIAKKSQFLITNTEKYFVKVCMLGINSSKMFDPLKDLIDELKRHDVHTGRNRYAYKVVNKECFDLYLSYLKTKNASFLRNAERNING